MGKEVMINNILIVSDYTQNEDVLLYNPWMEVSQYKI
jgi:hypothetical protein